jgi:hypothetical protein
LIGELLTKSYSHSASPIIVIDALDECSSDSSHEAQRKAPFRTLIQWSHLPKSFKLIVTGCEDRVPNSFRAVCKHMVLPTGSDVSAEVNQDIRLFFEERFAELPGSMFLEWPGEQVLDTLTARTGGLFIWSETFWSKARPRSN